MLGLGEKFVRTGRELIAKGVKVETDILIHDKRALVPLFLSRSLLLFPRRELFPPEWFWSRNVMMMGIDL